MKILIFIFTIAALFSCAKQKPKHAVYGKWESFSVPKAIYTFDSEDVKIELLDADGKVFRTERWGTTIIDEKKLNINQAIDGGGKSEIEAQIENNDELWIDCKKALRGLPTDTAPIDFPMVCNYTRFKRIKD